MKRLVLSICIAVATLGFGACEQHSADTLPEHYLHKGGGHNAGAGHEQTPEHPGKEKGPGESHKS
jgi:hypothetical protein